MDGANDQATQSGQIDAFIAEGVDVLIINPVNSSSAATITDKVVAAGIPLVYINREPAAEEEQRWADNNWNVCYVGCDARQSGTYQGEIIADMGLEKIDLNINLSQQGVLEEDIEWMADNCMKVSAVMLQNHPVVFTRDEVRDIYRAAL